MHIYNLDRWQHRHRYVIDDGPGERNTRRVIVLTLSMMVIEISAGYVFGSMALLADALTSLLAIVALLKGVGCSSTCDRKRRVIFK